MDLSVQNPAVPDTRRMNPSESPSGETIGHGFEMQRPVPHTQTQSTLAPTAEFTRIFLLAWVIRYVFRGFSGASFEKRLEQPGLRSTILNALSVPGRALENWMGGGTPKKGWELPELEAATYSGLVGVGSGLLSWQYSRMVRSDIQNLFRETVGYELGKPQEQVTFKDITQSDNQVIRRTVQNYREKSWSRLGTDALFLLATPLRSAHVTDLLLGVKGVQIFSDTWKRKTTMFEDLVSFVNNKINPRNGLGQPVSMGELFDLYQHYAEVHQPDKMLNNVLSRDSSQSQLQAINAPIFTRMTELMNLSYAYKHGNAAPEQVDKADFPLPKFIYLLGHDLIDPTRPERTIAAVEIMNAKGAAAVRDAMALIDRGVPPAQLLEQMGLSAKAPDPALARNGEKNAVLPKGSTMQLDGVPGTVVDTAGVNLSQLSQQAAQLAQ